MTGESGSRISVKILVLQPLSFVILHSPFALCHDNRMHPSTLLSSYVDQHRQGRKKGGVFSGQIGK